MSVQGSKGSEECQGNKARTRKFAYGPKHLAHRVTKPTPPSPILAFKHFAFSGSLKASIHVPQILFHAETRTSIPQFLDFNATDIFEYDFRALLGTTSRRTLVDAEWEAFTYFITWLHTGTYENFQIKCTHVDAYLLSETLQAPRFGNAVMETILATMPMRKSDKKLTEQVQQIFLNCEVVCPLRVLYFESAVFWKMAYGKRDSLYRGLQVMDDGLLALDLVEDEVLIEVLEKHRRQFCPCAEKLDEASGVAAGERGNDFIKPGGSADQPLEVGDCICQIAPWTRDRERFFIAT